MAESAGTVTVDGAAPGVALVTYTTLPIANHLSRQGAEVLAAGLAQARDDGARVAVLASGHPDHWIQHAWLPDLLALAAGEPQSADGTAVFDAVKQITRPGLVTIAAIEGDTAGGGCELGWACDLRVAGADASFGQIEAQLDLTPGLGGASRLVRLIGPAAAAAMVFDGRPVSASRVLELGGVNRVVEAGRAVDEAVAWGAEIAACDADVLTTAKQILRDAENLSLHDALRNEQALFHTVRDRGTEAMRAAQARYDAGESPRDVFGGPR